LGSPIERRYRLKGVLVTGSAKKLTGRAGPQSQRPGLHEIVNRRRQLHNLFAGQLLGR